LLRARDELVAVLASVLAVAAADGGAVVAAPRPVLREVRRESARDRRTEARREVVARDGGEAFDGRPERLALERRQVRDRVARAIGDVMEVRRRVVVLSDVVQRLVDRADPATGDLIGDRDDPGPLRRPGARAAEPIP